MNLQAVGLGLYMQAYVGLPIVLFLIIGTIRSNGCVTMVSSVKI